jgi:hypothetical protein
MAYLNANIPPIYCKIRKEYLYDFTGHHGESEDCVVFGLASISGKALLFHAMLPNGAVFYRLPISAFFQKRFSRSEVPDMSVDSLQEKIKNSIKVNTYLRLTGLILRLIY